MRSQFKGIKTYVDQDFTIKFAGSDSIDAEGAALVLVLLLELD